VWSRRDPATRRALTAAATLADPPLILRSHSGGENWTDRFRALDAAARARVVMKMLLGQLRARAKLNGYPLPIPYTCDLDADGNVDRSTLRPMTREEVLEILATYYD
jgi:hypothetical protein